MDLVALLEHLEHFEAGTNDARGQRVGEEVRTRALTEHVDDLLLTCGEATEGATESLTERARVDVHATVGLAELAHAVARSTYDTS